MDDTPSIRQEKCQEATARFSRSDPSFSFFSFFLWSPTLEECFSSKVVLVSLPLASYSYLVWRHTQILSLIFFFLKSTFFFDRWSCDTLSVQRESSTLLKELLNLTSFSFSSAILSDSQELMLPFSVTFFISPSSFFGVFFFLSCASFSAYDVYDDTKFLLLVRSTCQTVQIRKFVFVTVSRVKKIKRLW